MQKTCTASNTQKNFQTAVKQITKFGYPNSKKLKQKHLKIGFVEYLRISGEIRYLHGPIGYWKRVTIWKVACIVHVGAVIHHYQGEGASWSRKCLWWKECPGDLSWLRTDNVNFRGYTPSRPARGVSAIWPGLVFFWIFLVSLPPLILATFTF